MSSRVESYQSVATRAQAEVHDAIPAAWKYSPSALPLLSHANVTNIPRTCGILTPAQIEITELSMTELVAKLATGKLSSVDVTTAFCARAAIAHQLASFSRCRMSTFRLLTEQKHRQIA